MTFPRDGTASPAARGATLLLAAALLWGVLLAAGWLVTRVEPGTVIGEADVAAVRWLAEHRSGAVDTASAWSADLASTAAIVVVGLAAAVAASAVLRRWWPALVLAVALVGEVALFLATATLIERPRPPVAPLDAALPPTSSFPSGHTGAAICLYGGIAAIAIVATRAWWRWLVVAVAVALVLAVAAARLYRAAHHPTDVLAGVLLAVPWLMVTVRVLRPAGTTEPVASPGTRPPAPAA